MEQLYAALAPLYPEIAARLCRKHRHHSPGAAEAQLRASRRRADTCADPAALTVYECTSRCGRGVWHVGHARRRAA